MKLNFSVVTLDYSLEERIAMRLVDTQVLVHFIDQICDADCVDESEAMHLVLESIVQTDQSVRHIYNLQIIDAYIIPFVNSLPVEAYIGWVYATSDLLGISEAQLMHFIWDRTQMFLATYDSTKR